MEGFLVILGLILVFVPFIQLCHYLLKHVVKKTKFDLHIEKIRGKGPIAIWLAYAERIIYGLLVSSFGFWMSELFDNSIAFIVVVLSLVLYVIIKYFDVKNDVNNE